MKPVPKGDLPTRRWIPAGILSKIYTHPPTPTPYLPSGPNCFHFLQQIWRQSIINELESCPEFGFLLKVYFYDAFLFTSILNSCSLACPPTPGNIVLLIAVLSDFVRGLWTTVFYSVHLLLWVFHGIHSVTRKWLQNKTILKTYCSTIKRKIVKASFTLSPISKKNSPLFKSDD